MTIKERIHTALTGGMPDQVPFTVYGGSAHLRDDLDNLITPPSPLSNPLNGAPSALPQKQIPGSSKPCRTSGISENPF